MTREIVGWSGRSPVLSAGCRLPWALSADLYRPDIEQIESRYIHALVLEQFGLDVEPAAIAAKRAA